jgi:8-hydroxy-5-deazaflavin:NADPH oxidoreductase
MKITIIGTGNMARGIGTRTLAGGHKLILVEEKAGEGASLATELQSAARSGASVQAASEDAPIDGDIVVLAVPYQAAESVIRRYGDQLAGKIVVDITNPVNFDTMTPAVAPGTSGAEEIAKVAPSGAKVVKAFNTTFAGTLVEGEVAGQQLDVFIASDDASARETVAQFVRDGGMNPVDTGELMRARQLEAMGLLGMALQSRLDTGFQTAWKLVMPK